MPFTEVSLTEETTFTEVALTEETTWGPLGAIWEEATDLVGAWDAVSDNWEDMA
jgi:hypothetical protein|tara:strand:+ start:114 stop:275 length:162 start_codon:yes stop_codon:yes gene_type:complete